MATLNKDSSDPSPTMRSVLWLGMDLERGGGMRLAPWARPLPRGPPGDPPESPDGQPEEDREERVAEEDVRHDEEQEAREGPEGDHPFVVRREATVGERRDDGEYGEGVQADPLAGEHSPCAGDDAQVEQHQGVAGEVHHHVIAKHYEHEQPGEEGTIVTGLVLKPLVHTIDIIHAGGSGEL